MAHDVTPPASASTSVTTESERAALFTQAYTKHAGFVRAVLRRSAVPSAHLEDAEQDVFLAAYRGLATFEGRSGLSTWLFRIAVRVASRYRTKHRRVWDPASEQLPDPGRDPEKVSREVEALRIVDRCLRRLDDDKWMVLVLSDIDGRSGNEVAELLNISPATVYTRLYRARRLLRRELEREGQPRPFWAAVGWPWSQRSRTMAAVGSASSLAVALALVLALLIVAIAALLSDSPSSVDQTSRLDLTASSARFQPAAPSAESVNVDAKASEGTTGTARVSGRVLEGPAGNPTALPIASARVCLWPIDGPVIDQQPDRPAPVCTTTRLDGTYTLQRLVDGRYHLVVSADGYVPSLPELHRTTPLPLGAHASIERTVWLDRGGVALSGRVIDIAGGPVADARVLVQSMGSRYVDIVRQAGLDVRTDEDGHFSAHVPSGPVSLWTEAAGYTGAGVQVSAPSSSTVVTLLPESVITGHARWADTHEPVMGARVTASPDAGSSYEAALTDEWGQFALAGLTPGRLHVNAVHPLGSTAGHVPVVLGLATTSDGVELVLERGHSFDAMVHVATREPTSPERPCTSGRVTFQPDLATTLRIGRQRIAMIARDGTVHIDGLLPDQYTVRIGCTGTPAFFVPGPLEIDEHGLADRSPVRWVVPAGVSVQGTVLSGDGDVQPGLWVQFAAIDGPRNGNTPEVLTDERGQFTVYGLPPGRYAATLATRDSRDEASVAQLTVAEDDIVGLKLIRSPHGQVHGRVVQANGQPVVGAQILAMRDAAVAAAVTDEEGHFHLHHVPIGESQLLAESGDEQLEATGGGLAQITIDVEANATTEAELRVASLDQALRGIVVDADGHPVPNAFVQTSVTGELEAAVSILRDPMRWSRSRRFVLTDAHGHFVFDHVPALTHGVRAFLPSGADGIVLATPGDEPTIVLEDVATLTGTVRLPDGSAPARFLISTYYPYRREPVLSDDGRFVIHGVRPGKRQWGFSAEEGSAAVEITSLAGETEAVEVVLQPRGSVRGRMVDFHGRPVAGVEVRASDQLGGVSYWLSDGAKRRLTTDANGRFVLPVVDSGRIELDVRPPPLARFPEMFWAPVMVTPGAANEVGDIVIPPRRVPPHRTTGRVGVQTSLRTGTTLDDDRFVIADVMPGSAADAASLRAGDVVIAVDGHDVTGRRAYLADSLLRVPASTTIVLTLESGATVSVRPR